MVHSYTTVSIMLLFAIVGTNGAQLPWGCTCGTNSFSGPHTGPSYTASCGNTPDYCTTTCTGSNGDGVGAATIYTAAGCAACCLYCCAPPPPPAPVCPPPPTATVAHAAGTAPASCSCIPFSAAYGRAAFDAGSRDASYADASAARGTADAYGSDPCPANNDRCGVCDAAYHAAFPTRIDDATVRAYVACCNYCCVPAAPSARRRDYRPVQFNRRRYDSDSFEEK